MTADGYGTAERVARHETAAPRTRSRCGRCAFAAGVSFLLWYTAYVLTASTLPELLAHPVVGPLNVAALAGAAQCVSTVAVVGMCWRARHR